MSPGVGVRPVGLPLPDRSRGPGPTSGCRRCELFDRALTHRSYAYERGGLPTNERLEFLGDSVLGLVVTEHLFVSYPDLSEGQLAKLRAAVVNSRALADVARGLELGALIHLGRARRAPAAATSPRSSRTRWRR